MAETPSQSSGTNESTQATAGDSDECSSDEGNGAAPDESSGEESGTPLFRPPAPKKKPVSSSDESDADDEADPAQGAEDSGREPMSDDEASSVAGSDVSMAPTVVPKWNGESQEEEFFSDGLHKTPETKLQKKLDRAKSDLSPNEETDSAEDGDASSSGLLVLYRTRTFLFVLFLGGVWLSFEGRSPQFRFRGGGQRLSLQGVPSLVCQGTCQGVR